MSKLINKAKGSKLREALAKGAKDSIEEESVVRKIKPKEYPRSYRLDHEIMNILQDTVDRINEISPKKISEARLVKALIVLSKQIEDEKIIKALKEVW
jgi:hypothetical protein